MIPNKNKLNEAIDFFGKESQTKKTIEELAELIKELINIDEDGARERIVSETADVMNMLFQMMIILNIEDFEIETMMNNKMVRCMERIKDGTYKVRVKTESKSTKKG